MYRTAKDLRIGSGSLSREVEIRAKTVLGILASPRQVTNFVEEFGLRQRKSLQTFSEHLASTKAGIAEVVIPPGSSLIGKSALDIWMRKKYGLSTLAVHRRGEDVVVPHFAGDEGVEIVSTIQE